ncbi:hypothetical protein HHK36_019234 [Tetracentron sinense]|uniref:Thaumatin-like protein n=1 Tax=Tetracentron sinense TaxID=13715 RepID=A0A834YYX5_TETSI|nr:hypothetical protein HHK36_019234 [Tetracentron sinense]
MAKGALLNFILLALLVAGGHSATFIYSSNKCTFPVWIAASPSIGLTEFEYGRDALHVLKTKEQWSGSLWLMTGCTYNHHGKFMNFTCATGDCGMKDGYCDSSPPTYPVTLLNFNISHSVVTYEVSLNHGFNVPVRIEPVGGTGSCRTVDCARNILDVCPADLQFKDSKGRLLGCRSACDALKDPKYCCTGDYSSPQACHPNHYSQIFKQACSLAHTYPGDTNPPIQQCTGATYSGHSATIFYSLNMCKYPVWMSASPSIGYSMSEFDQDTLDIFETPEQWSGSIWLRTGCVKNDTSFTLTCATGDCGTNDDLCDGPPPTYPVTLLNFNINHSVVTYEVSLNHGYNVPVRIEPIGGTGSCQTVDCIYSIFNVCPAELIFSNSKGAFVGCQSACDALKDPQYCCTGDYSSPQACQPNKYSQTFKQVCALAHTYPGDTNPPMQQCTGANYNITFCPL